MTIARKRQVDFNATPCYHCIGRFVGRAFLWGRLRMLPADQGGRWFRNSCEGLFGNV